jgi:hypothetical protein
LELLAEDEELPTTIRAALLEEIVRRRDIPVVFDANRVSCVSSSVLKSVTEEIEKIIHELQFPDQVDSKEHYTTIMKRERQRYDHMCELIKAELEHGI